MKNIGYRIDKKTEEYLLTIAKQNDLFNPTNEEPSIGLAAKEIIKWCMKNKIDISKNINDLCPETRKMIEQIHLSMPHLLMMGRMNLQPLVDDLSAEKTKEIRSEAVSYINKTCGAFQNVHYEDVRVTINRVGLKEAPESEENSQWK